MIRDLFSHKIHSSSDEWPEKLSELAAIFGEFDGLLFDREAFENRLSKISPRSSYLTAGRKDISKFRDEISAYPAYLGLYFLERSPKGWIVKVSETAKRFLLCEEPDVASFLRLQLPLFQYPNAMGAAYKSFTNNLRIQANVRSRSLQFINQGVHFSPVRLIATALKADANLKKISALEAKVTFDEIFALANNSLVNKYALPPLKQVEITLADIRANKIVGPPKFENRFHILRHNELFIVDTRTAKLRKSVNKTDQDHLLRHFEAICNIDCQFDFFNQCKNSKDIEEVIASGKWGHYFDGVKVLKSHIVEILGSDKVLKEYAPLTLGKRDTEKNNH